MPDPKSFIVIVPILIFMIPIVAILTSHQQKMAELMHRKAGNNPELPTTDGELASLRQDMARLQQVVSTLAISVDNLKDEVRAKSELQDRIKVNES